MSFAGSRSSLHRVAVEGASESSGPRPPAPFVVGMARSGTTLLRMMLDAHSELAIPPETQWTPALKAFNQGGVESAIETMVRDEEWESFKLPAEEFARRLRDAHPENFGDILRLFYEFYAERRGKQRWGDKTPYYSFVMRVIQRHLPEASFVHIVRDGRDVALSMVPLGFGPNSYAEAAELWSRTLESTRLQAPDLRSYVEVGYEELVRDPAAVLEGLCEFLELDWEPSMLDYHIDASQRLWEETVELCLPHRVVPPSERVAIHRLLGSSPQCDRIGRWRREMSVSDLRTFERIAGEMLESCGYELSDA